jgi:diaminohydroxyphosphoribosylaminopyrimidine deaminase/5-amino-6-(5-phosphoribosylamino)uracil reductase
VDSGGSLSPDSKVFLRSDQTQVILASTSKLSKESHAVLYNRGINIIQVEDQQGRVDLQALLRCLGQQGIDSIMLEGGGRLNESFLKAGLIDKIMLFVAPKIIGGSNAVSCFYGDGIEKMSDAIKINDLTVISCGSDLLIEGYPEYSKEE